MTHLTDLALGVAVAAHAGQTDKAGEPYIGHPRRVARILERANGFSEDETVLAYLHDVVEDTAVELETLAPFFPPAILDALDAITHRIGESRADYYARVKANPLALSVKFADIADNTDPWRLGRLDAWTRKRLRLKYAKALEALHTVTEP